MQIPTFKLITILPVPYYPNNKDHLSLLGKVHFNLLWVVLNQRGQIHFAFDLDGFMGISPRIQGYRNFRSNFGSGMRYWTGIFIKQPYTPIQIPFQMYIIPIYTYRFYVLKIRIRNSPSRRKRNCPLSYKNQIFILCS